LPPAQPVGQANSASLPELREQDGVTEAALQRILELPAFAGGKPWGAVLLEAPGNGPAWLDRNGRGGATARSPARPAGRTGEPGDHRHRRGSTDGTAEAARQAGATLVLSAQRGRGQQIAAGVAAACGATLLFLHADCAFPPGGLVALERPTTRAIDLNEKLEEYKTVPTLQYIVLVDTDHPFVRIVEGRIVVGLATKWLGWTRSSICRCSTSTCRSPICTRA
jgi:hypothetical protein